MKQVYMPISVVTSTECVTVIKIDLEIYILAVARDSIRVNVGYHGKYVYINNSLCVIIYINYITVKNH